MQNKFNTNLTVFDTKYEKLFDDEQFYLNFPHLDLCLLELFYSEHLTSKLHVLVFKIFKIRALFLIL